MLIGDGYYYYKMAHVIFAVKLIDGVELLVNYINKLKFNLMVFPVILIMKIYNREISLTFDKMLKYLKYIKVYLNIQYISQIKFNKYTYTDIIHCTAGGTVMPNVTCM